MHVCSGSTVLGFGVLSYSSNLTDRQCIYFLQERTRATLLYDLYKTMREQREHGQRADRESLVIQYGGA